MSARKIEGSPKLMEWRFLSDNKFLSRYQKYFRSLYTIFKLKLLETRLPHSLLSSLHKKEDENNALGK